MRVLVLSMLLSLSTGIARGQEAPEHEAESETKNELSVFTGVLTNLAEKETGPSIGADFTRELTEVISLAILGEFAQAGEREALFAGGLVVKPGRNFKLVFAPGIILENEESDSSDEEHDGAESAEGHSGGGRFVARLGVGYSFESSMVLLTPIIYFDLLEGVEDAIDAHLVFGLTVGFPF